MEQFQTSALIIAIACGYPGISGATGHSFPMSFRNSSFIPDQIPFLGCRKKGHLKNRYFNYFEIMCICV